VIVSSHTSSKPNWHAYKSGLLRRGFAVAAALVCVFGLQAGCARQAFAHLGRISYSDVVIDGTTLSYRIRFAAHLIPGMSIGADGKTDRRSILAHEAEVVQWLGDGIQVLVGGHACEPSLEDVLGPDRRDDLTVVLLYQCPSEISSLRIRFHPFDVVQPQFRNIVSIRRGAHSWSYVFSPEAPLLIFGDAGGSAQAHGGFADFFLLGVQHILSGYDHLLFLLALLLLGGSIRHLAGIITAFTIAHSITLGLATLDLFSLPPGPVEVAIAASIVYVAVENLIVSEADHRWMVTFFFGLVHGFGFAGVLREAGLTAGNTAIPLLAFNLGVEAGQLAVVLPTVPLLAFLRARLGERNVLIPLSCINIVIGVYWILQRV